MRAGQYRDGEKKFFVQKLTWRIRNMHMRDPLMYRISTHTIIARAINGYLPDVWFCARPKWFDWEHYTQHLYAGVYPAPRCTIGLLEKLEIYPSHQYEFARLNMTYTVMSKRKVVATCKRKHVSGWDDPRMPTLSGVKKRYTPASIREFCDRIGVAKRENLIDVGLLEFCVREDLNKTAQRRMVVFDPIKVVITNYPEGKSKCWMGRTIPRIRMAEHGRCRLAGDFNWGGRLYGSCPKKYFRLAPGQMVRLKNAYIIKCDDVVRRQQWQSQRTYIANTFRKAKADRTSGINVKGTLHWVCAKHVVPVEARLYERLFKVEDLGEAEGDFKDYLNPDSLQIKTVYAEPALLKKIQTIWGSNFCAKDILWWTRIQYLANRCLTARLH